MKYTVKFKRTEEGYEDGVEKITITKEQYQQLVKMLNLRNKELVIQLPYNDVGTAEIDEEDLKEVTNKLLFVNGVLNLDAVTDWLEESDYCQWDDETGDEDNELPFRVLINDKYVIEFTVERGDCIEASWDGRIWSAICSNIKLIETK